MKTIAARELKAEVESLRKVEAKRIKEIEKLQTRRSQIEADAAQRSEQEAQLVAELEAISARVELNEQTWPEKELSIKAQIEALRKAEAIQLKRLGKWKPNFTPKKQAVNRPRRRPRVAEQNRSSRCESDREEQSWPRRA